MKRSLSVLILLVGFFQISAQQLSTGNNQTITGDLNTRFSADDIAELQGMGLNPEDIQAHELVLTAHPDYKTTACPAAYTLIAPYNTNNGQRGAMFDITATTTVTIRCFESSLYSGTTANYEIYYRPSTFVGFANSSAGWTLLGSVTGITSAGNNLPTPLPIPINVTIPAGARYAFYITNDFGGGTSYTDGTAVGNFLAGDANMTIYEGVGKSYPFGLSFTVRNWNGTIFYDQGVILDAESAHLQAAVVGNEVEVSWNIEAGHQFTQAQLQWSEDMTEFTQLADLDVQQQSGIFYENRRETDSWYRIQFTDASGNQFFSNVEWVGKQSGHSIRDLTVWPNPVADNALVRLPNEDGFALEMQLRDACGKPVLHQNFLEGTREFEVQTAELPSGIYYLEISGGGNTLQKKLVHL